LNEWKVESGRVISVGAVAGNEGKNKGLIPGWGGEEIIFFLGQTDFQPGGCPRVRQLQVWDTGLEAAILYYPVTLHHCS
jgi:hypothetical protein